MQDLYIWLDAFLIAPFRLVSNSHMGMWLGCVVLSVYCVLIGNLLYNLIIRLHIKYYSHLYAEMQDYHKISMNALHAGNKEAYFAANKLAHEYFGKHFFARASVGMATLLPVPFALAWLALRFEGINLYTLPFTSLHAGYVFVFLTTYIVVRIMSGRIVHILKRRSTLGEGGER